MVRLITGELQSYWTGVGCCRRRVSLYPYPHVTVCRGSRRHAANKLVIAVEGGAAAAKRLALFALLLLFKLAADWSYFRSIATRK